MLRHVINASAFRGSLYCATQIIFSGKFIPQVYTRDPMLLLGTDLYAESQTVRLLNRMPIRLIGNIPLGDGARGKCSVFHVVSHQHAHTLLNPPDVFHVIRAGSSLYQSERRNRQRRPTSLQISIVFLSSKTLQPILSA
jgi:hypothetical protein